MAIYLSDPHAEPDSAFVEGTLHHLVPGGRGRLRDARRTLLRITRVMPEIGSFELEIEAFEDQGARWQLPLDRISDLQFPRGAVRATEAAVAELRAAAARFDRPLAVAADATTRQRTQREIDTVAAVLRVGLLADLPPIDLPDHIERREGQPALASRLNRMLEERGLADLEDAFTRAFVSNPHAGEMVKGHAIVLAELGLCPYDGTIVRDPATFAPPWTRARRAEHLTARLAFSHALWTRLGHDAVTLFRGAAADGPLVSRATISLVSATFAEAVALAHYAGGPTTHTAILTRQRVPVSRLLMTFFETPAFNERYREAEAVLIGDPGNLTF